MIDVDAAAENTMVVFLAIEELRKDTEDGWKKLTVPLDSSCSPININVMSITMSTFINGHA